MYTEETPNPLAMKFIIGKPFVAEGFFLFSSLTETHQHPFLEDVMSLPGVQSVLLTPDFMTVTKTDAVPWRLLSSIILTACQHHSSSFPCDFSHHAEKIAVHAWQGWTPENEEIASLCVAIERIIEEKIRPAIAEDGGMITFHAFKDGIVYVSLQGACDGCPSSTITLKGGVAQTLSFHIPEVQDVLLC